jgi:pantoate--beta-alanine ligase
MGALHEGHLALVTEAKRHAPIVAASIFVNPTQFGPNEDFARYPRDLETDLAKLDAAGAELLFVPDVAEMYPAGEQTRVNVPLVAAPLCGRFRPGHFEGVATVVTKLLAIAGPCTAVFGRKDYQQLAVIRRLVLDLRLPVTVVGVPTVRDLDGLAKSSRNLYLSLEQRARSLAIPQALASAQSAFASGERNAEALAQMARCLVDAAADSIDYVEVVDADSLGPVMDNKVDERALLAVACHVGQTRLIDNVVLGDDAPVIVAA